MDNVRDGDKIDPKLIFLILNDTKLVSIIPK